MPFNNAAERALRGIALGRKSWLFAGSDRGGERAAAMYSLIVTAKLNSTDPRLACRCPAPDRRPSRVTPARAAAVELGTAGRQTGGMNQISRTRKTETLDSQGDCI